MYDAVRRYEIDLFRRKKGNFFHCFSVKCLKGSKLITVPK